MPAAPFFEVSPDLPAAPGVRQYVIGPEQCRWIIADEDTGADALMCGAPSMRRRPFCDDHCAQAYLKVAEDEAAEAAEEEIPEDDPEKEKAAE